MKTTFASLALFAVGALAQQLTINTPANVVECQPTMLTWSGGSPPYYLSILPGATPNGAAIEQLPSTNSTSITWICNIQANTYIGLTLRDGAGTVAQSAPFTINPGTSTSCTNMTSIIPGPTGVSGAPSASSPASGNAPSTPAGSTPTGSATAAPAATTSKSAASANIAQVGAAGVVGVAVAALFL